jgi:uncharacterized membrane protein YfcA
MIAHGIVAFAALFVSGLTLYSGFGLGTLLMPVFALFFPVQSAVVATALVHGTNNLLKAALLGRRADWSLVLRFGLPALLAAFAGAAALGYASRLAPAATYAAFGIQASVTPLKLLMAAMMVLFALFELVPRLKELHIDRNCLVLGGVLSGFFGGFSGHQGALRSTFLTKMDLSTEAFVASNAVIGLMVDAARIVVYGVVYFAMPEAGIVAPEHWTLIATGVLAAFAGVLLGTRFVRKVTMHTVKTIAGILLLVIAAALAAGLL